MFLPAEIIPILAQFAPVFTAPTYQKALLLVVGTILAKGRRTVTAPCGRWATRKRRTGPSTITC